VAKHKSTPFEKGVLVGSLDEGLEHLRNFCHENVHSISWSIIMEKDGELRVFDRPNQPCYGELRVYGEDCVNEDQRSVIKPSDLDDPFPEGTPVAVGVAMDNPAGFPDAVENYNFVLGLFLDPEKSPWRKALKSFETTTNPHGSIDGLIIKDTNIDPTVMVNLFMMLRNIYPEWGERLKKLVETFPDTDVYILLATYITTSWYNTGNGVWKVQLVSPFDYYVSSSLDIKKFLSGEVDDLSSGGTLKERYSYNRPKLHYLFGNTGKGLYKTITEAMTPEELKANTVLPYNSVHLPDYTKIVNHYTEQAAA
jgi:hypothetical protein